MTRAEIRAKYGVRTFEDPKISNKILTEKEAENYEIFIKSFVDNFQMLLEESEENDETI